MRHTISIIVATAVALGCSSGNEPATEEYAELQVASTDLLDRASVSEEQARAIALEVSSGGTIVEAELEEEGDLLLYSFEVRLTEGGLMDVEVDAVSGEVLEAKMDDEEDDDEDDDDDDDEGR
jgi:uncharacterized membrane protein YkoI